jgi:N-acetyl-anhydromuramyl-L-alanine amidase AmpD
MFRGRDHAIKDPTSRLSAHYFIGQDGRIAQLVSEDDTAYPAGARASGLDDAVTALAGESDP